MASIVQYAHFCPKLLLLDGEPIYPVGRRRDIQRVVLVEALCVVCWELYLPVFIFSVEPKCNGTDHGTSNEGCTYLELETKHDELEGRDGFLFEFPTLVALLYREGRM